MSQIGSPAHPPLVRGQFYQISSFDLGFINIHPTLLLVEIAKMDREKNELTLRILPASASETTDAFVLIARWFTEVYPQRTGENCALKNLSVFELLIAGKLAILHHTIPEDHRSSDIPPAFHR